MPLLEFNVSDKGAIQFAFITNIVHPAQAIIRRQRFIRCQACTTVFNRHRSGVQVSVIVGSQLHTYCSNHGSQFLQSMV